jgi:hypothetical protein
VVEPVLEPRGAGPRRGETARAPHRGGSSFGHGHYGQLVTASPYSACFGLTLSGAKLVTQFVL